MSSKGLAKDPLFFLGTGNRKKPGKYWTSGSGRCLNAIDFNHKMII